MDKMTVMQGYPDTVFYTILILQILCLALLTRFVLHHDNLRFRVLVPILALAGTGIAGGILKQIGPDMGGILWFMVPTLAVLTLFPFAEQYAAMKRPGLTVAFSSLILTFILLWYLLGMAFGGVGIFLPVEGISLFSGVWFEVRLVSIYLELLMLGFTLLGMIALVQDMSLPYSRDPAFIVLYCMILGIAAALFNTLAAGFFAVFIISVLSGVRSRAMKALIPVIGAAGISFILSALPATYQYADVASRYDPSLYILVLVALGVLTFTPPLLNSTETRDRTIALYATATITTIILALLYRSPAQDLFHAVTAGITTIAGSGLVMPGTGFLSGFTRMMVFYATAAMIAVLVCPAFRWAVSRYHLRKRRSSPSPETRS
jgi:uncharacterized membrane protein YuzA (DUF378 family)